MFCANASEVLGLRFEVCPKDSFGEVDVKNLLGTQNWGYGCTFKWMDRPERLGAWIGRRVCRGLPGKFFSYKKRNWVPPL